jgi:hypothetical protein
MLCLDVSCVRWSRLGALSNAARELITVDLADVALFVLRLPGSEHNGIDGTQACRRFVHLVAQRMEQALESCAKDDVGDDHQHSTSSITKATKRNPVVKAYCISKRFLCKPSRGLLTAAAGGLHPAFAKKEQDHGEGRGPQVNLGRDETAATKPHICGSSYGCGARAVSRRVWISLVKRARVAKKLRVSNAI